MKYFSFKILILCILLPPLLYLGTVQGLDRYFTGYYKNKIQNIYLSDMNAILNGTVRLQNAINQSIQQYIDNNFLLNFGVDLDITVATQDGSILYPPMMEPGTGSDISDKTPMEIARENFRTLSDGLNLEVEAEIRPYSVLAVGILLFYILIVGSGLYLYFRRVSKKARREEEEKAAELERLHRLEDDFARQVSALSAERENLLTEYRQLQTALEEQKQKASQNEEEMFEEIENLEQKLQDNLAQQEEQESQILSLEDKIGELEKLRENLEKQKEKAVEKLSKRFKTLYKNVEVYERALLGLSELTDDMALKAEEIIHQLNDDPSAVPIKRKVFSKKGKATVFEVVFAYNGRIYYRKNGQNRVEVMTVGTKNTQSKDLAYLDRF